jgi:saccharopine dehydrogenase-like NADP-dependent oxidoreductase
MMKKVLILGSGMVARPIIRHLLGSGYAVTVASNTPDRTAQMIDGHPNGTSVDWDAADETALDSLMAAHDLTVSLLPYAFHVMVARHCIRNKKHMVTTSYVKPEMKALDTAAQEAGVIILNEIGLDPGIDHMSAMRIIDHVHRKEGAILEFYSLCGALPAPEAAGDNPFRYKFSWSPRGVVLAGNNDAVFLKNGKVISLPTKDLFKNPFQVDFPGAGLLDVYPNRDSLSYQEIYGIPETQTMYRGTFRYPGWCETLDVMKQLNLISTENFNMEGMTYQEIVGHQFSGIRHPASGIRHLVSEVLGIPEGAHALTALQWLGYFDDKPAGRKTDCTFEVTAALMLEKMMLGPMDRDMVAMQHTFVAAYSDGRKEVIRSRMLDFGIPGGDTSIARTVALPAAIAVEMILEGQIGITGVHIPVIPEIYNPVLDRLEEMDIRMVEEYGLPYSENYL